MDERFQSSDALLSEAAEALFRFGRLFSRVGVSTGGIGQHVRPVELSRILVVQAVETAHSRTQQEVTVGVIAQHLAVEPSTASRLVADTIKDGYILRRVSSLDSRRVHLDLTDAGRTLAQEVRTYQRHVFQQVTREWTNDERTAFARLFVQFTDAIAESLQTQTARIAHVSNNNEREVS